MNLNSSWLDWCREYKKAAYTETVELTHNLLLKELDKGTKKNNLISTITKKRAYKLDTIERQIIQLIVKGLLDINLILERNNKEEILTYIENNPETAKLSEIKNNINQDISWFEIKAVIASLGINP